MIKDVLLVNRHHTQDRDLEESSLPYYIQDKSEGISWASHL
jgi:hypothetical protein